MILPANIDVSAAQLPATYEHAKQALANCASIDECQEWANKAHALASYARMADDDSLRKLADRIQARAVRRCGELLKQFDARGAHMKRDATGPSQRTMAGAAGISERQAKTAVRVANIPEADFTAAVESETPPTVTTLAAMGKRPSPGGFKKATEVLGTVEEFSAFCRANDPELVASGVYDYEVQKLRGHVATIDAWLDRFVVNLKD